MKGNTFHMLPATLALLSLLAVTFLGMAPAESQTVSAGTLFGVRISPGPTPPVGRPQFVSIPAGAPGTGTLTSLGAGFQGFRVAQGVSALNRADGRYFTYMEEAASGRRLVEIETTGTDAGSTAASHVLVQALVSLAFDPLSQMLFGIAISTGTTTPAGTPTFVRIDPQAQPPAPFLTLLGPGLTMPNQPSQRLRVAQGVSALDPANYRYFTYAEGPTPGRQLAVIDIQAGTTVAAHALNHALASLEFDAATNMLFGVAISAGTGGIPAGTPLLVRIDPVNGTVTELGTGLNTMSDKFRVAQGVSALDNASRYFAYAEDSAFARLLLEIDTANGSVLASRSLPEALASLEFDPTNTPVGASVTVVPLDTTTRTAAGVELTFSGVSQAGTTSLTTTTGPPPPAGFELLGTVYNLTTTAQFSSVVVCITYNDTGLTPADESALELRRYNATTGQWDHVTGTRDPVNNRICSQALTSLSLFAIFKPKAAEITVGIDIKPGSFPNSINPRSAGKIPVAILSSAGFDAPARVDRSSLTFGRTGDEPSLAFCNATAEDVNGDGRADLVCHFETQRTGFQGVTGNTQGILKGRTLDGVRLRGADAVRIVPQK